MFETPRLRVRAFRAEDAEALYQNHLDEEVKTWFPNECYADLAEAEGAIRFYTERVQQKRLPYVLAVELKETGALIGDTGVSSEAKGLEIGYVIGKTYRGNGYATELVDAMTQFVFSALGASAISGRVIKGNIASARILEKCGYRFVKEEFGTEDDPYGQGMLVYQKEK